MTVDLGSEIRQQQPRVRLPDEPERVLPVVREGGVEGEQGVVEGLGLGLVVPCARDGVLRRVDTVGEPGAWRVLEEQHVRRGIP